MAILKTRILSTSALALSLPLLTALAAEAADWGYDGAAPQKSSTPTVFAGKHVVQEATSPAPKGSGKPATKTSEANPFGRGSRSSASADESAENETASKATMSSKTIQAKKPSSSGTKMNVKTPLKTTGKIPTKNADAITSENSSGNQPDVIDLHSLNKARDAKEAAGIRALADKEKRTVNDWLEVYTLVSQEHKLSDDQRTRFSNELARCVNGPQKSSFESVLTFWPMVQKSIKAVPEQKDNYRSFFKSLFRLQLHSGALSEHESNILSEILGPERIAIPGPPNLTEEALDAYGDMACFMYTQNNPGKSIDAMDNRAIFSSVIQKKFTEAPSIADKQSMANFALKWGKFKVLFADANEAQKEQLVQQITGKSKGSKKPDVPNATIENIMGHGPWVSALNSMAAAQKAANAQGPNSPNTQLNTKNSAQSPDDIKDSIQGEAAKAGALSDMVAPPK